MLPSRYDEVVSYLLEAPLSVPAVDVGYCVVLALMGGRAVDDDFSNASHNGLRIMGYFDCAQHKYGTLPFATFPPKFRHKDTTS